MTRPGTDLQVRCVPHPFAARGADMVVPAEARLTIAEIVSKALPALPEGVPVVVAVGDRPVPREAWSRVRPRAGHMITVRPVPMGGGGGKNILGTLLSIAVLAAAAFVSGGALAGVLGPAFAAGSLGATALAAGVSVVGGLLVNAIAPPPKPRLPELGGAREQVSPTLFIEGARNQARPYGVVPRVFGRHRMLPPLAAQQYTEVLGDDQYLRGLVTWGYGPVSVEDVRLGETPLSTFSGVETQTRSGTAADAPTTLYPKAVAEQSVGVQLNTGRWPSGSTAWMQRRSALEADELSVDLVLPQGMYWVATNGDTVFLTITARIEYMPVTGGAWTLAAEISRTHHQRSAVRLTHRWAVPRGQYDVRVRFVSTELGSWASGNEAEIVDALFWAALRTFTNEDPVAHPGLARTAFRFKATNQLNGPVDTLNGIVTSLMRDYDGVSWSTVRATRNPASHMVEVLTEHRDGASPSNPYRANARAVSDDRIDWDAFEAFHDRCADKGWTFDHIVDYRTSVWQLLLLIGSAGRASPGIIDGKWSVVMDRPQNAAVQMFTPRNSWGFKFEQAFPDQPHALRCGFVNADKDWQADEITVYADGYDAATATRIEGVDYPGVTSASAVWQRARFDLAQARLRPAEYTLSVDVENLTVTRGDLVAVAHDVLIIGQNYGRLAQVTQAGSDVTHLVLDDSATMEAGKSYVLAVRRASLTTVTIPVVTVAGETDTVALASPTAAAALDVAPGDLFAFGEAGIETGRYVVTGIEPGPDLTARLRLVDEAAGVHTADQGAIPAFDSKLGQRVFDRRPPQPRIESVRSDETVLVRAGDGALETRMVIQFQYPSGVTAEAVRIEARLRVPGGDWLLGRIAETRPGVVALGDLEDGVELEVSLRSVAVNGRTSEWSPPVRHVVVGKSTPPPDVPVLFVEGAYLRWEYPNAPLDFAGFRVRHRSSEAAGTGDATLAHQGLVTVNEFPVASLPRGIKAVFVTAVDVAGNESATPAVALFDLGDPVVANVVASEDIAAAGFPGTLTGGERDAGALKADGASLMWGEAASTPMWAVGPSAGMWAGTFEAMTYEFDRVFAVEDADTTLTISHSTTGDPWHLEYRRNGAGAVWSVDAARPMWAEDTARPMWSPVEIWRAWPGQISVRPERYFFRIRTGNSTTRGEVTALVLSLDVPDVVEYVENAMVSAGGTRLSLTKAFRAIRAVNLTLQDDAGSAVDARVLDKSTTGPLVRAFDAGGSGAAATIDAIVQGY